MSFTAQIAATGALVALVSFILGWLSREPENRWLRMELGIANDQLRAAVFAGGVVPPRQAVAPRESKGPLVDAGETPIPDYLAPFILRYESDEGKAAARGEIFALRARGMNDDEIWLHLQRLHPDLQ